MGQWLDSLTGWLSANPQWLGLAIFLVACIECLAIAGIIVAGAALLLRTRFRPSERLRTLTLMLGGLILSQFLAPLVVLATAGVVGWFWPDADGLPQ